MKTRTQRRVPFLQSKLAFLILLWLIIAASTYGFVVYGLDASYQLEHFAPEYVHPIDYYAEAGLSIALIAGITMFLTRVPSSPNRYRRTSTGHGWFTARPSEFERRHLTAKPRRRMV